MSTSSLPHLKLVFPVADSKGRTDGGGGGCPSLYWPQTLFIYFSHEGTFSRLSHFVAWICDKRRRGWYIVFRPFAPFTKYLDLWLTLSLEINICPSLENSPWHQETRRLVLSVALHYTAPSRVLRRIGFIRSDACGKTECRHGPRTNQPSGINHRPRAERKQFLQQLCMC